MRELTARELKQQLAHNPDIVLIDVREPYEYDICHLENARHIPLQKIPRQLDRIPRNQLVVIYCHHGIRSASVVQYLSALHNYKNLCNLKGGIHAWAQEVDQNIPVY